MRRPLLIIFIVMILISYIKTSNMHLDKYEDNTILTVEGCVKEINVKERYNEYKIDKIMIRDYTKNRKIKVGQILNVKIKIKSLNSMNNKQFNYGLYIKSMGYEGLGYIQEYSIIGDNLFYKSIGQLKIYIDEKIKYLYKNNSDFINSILIGEKNNLSEEEKIVFSKTGTSHIVSISGLHTGILCGIIIFLIGKVNNVYKLIFMTIMMLIYCIIVGMIPSIIRAILFIVILYISIFLDRKRDSISTLSIIGIFFVSNNPYIIYNVSFQLSFLATLSIIYFYGYINDIIKISIISLTISANILTLPIIYYKFGNIPILSIVGNLIIVPFLGIIIYLSIISLILFKINIGMSKLIANLNKIIINTIYILLENLSRFSFANIQINNPKLHYVIIYYTIVFSYMICKELKVMKEQENGLQGYYKEY